MKSITNKENVRTGKRDRNPQLCDSSAAATTTATTMKGQATTKEDTAWRWWNDHLKASDWIRFTPKAKFCELDGFLPVQYKMGRDNRKAVAHVLKHGERGVHYAIGWKELYRLVKRYGELERSTTFRPGAEHEIMLDYEGPPLALEEQSSIKKPFTTALTSPTGPPGPGLHGRFIPSVEGLKNSKWKKSGLCNVTYEQDAAISKFCHGPSYDAQVPGNRSLIFTKTNKRKHGSKDLSLPPPSNSTSNGQAKSTSRVAELRLDNADPVHDEPRDCTVRSPALFNNHNIQKRPRSNYGRESLSPPPTLTTSNGETNSTSLVESARRHDADAANDELPKALKPKVPRKSSTTQNFEEWSAAQDKLAIAAFMEGYTEAFSGKVKRSCQ
jgi:hypothetical protein